MDSLHILYVENCLLLIESIIDIYHWMDTFTRFYSP